MGKSLRSKWKKMHRKLKSEREHETISERLAGLHDKLCAAANGSLHEQPLEAPSKNYSHQAPRNNGPFLLTPSQLVQHKPATSGNTSEALPPTKLRTAVDTKGSKKFKATRATHESAGKKKPATGSRLVSGLKKKVVRSNDL